MTALFIYHLFLCVTKSDFQGTSDHQIFNVVDAFSVLLLLVLVEIWFSHITVVVSDTPLVMYEHRALLLQLKGVLRSQKKWRLKKYIDDDDFIIYFKKTT